MTTDVWIDTETVLEVPRPRERELSAARRAVTALFLINGMLLATWVSRIPAVEIARGLSHGAFGLALLTVAAGAVISMPLAGALSARWGTDLICKIAALTYCLATPFLALAPGPLSWGLGLFIFGAGHGALDVSMNAQAVAIEKGYRRHIMSSFHALFSTGGLVGAVLGGLIAALGISPALHFCLMAVVLGIAMLLTFPHLLPHGRTGLAEVEKAPVFRLPARGLIALGIIALCSMIGEGAMADWSAVYLKQTLATSEGFAVAGYAAFSIAMAVGRFTGDGLAAQFGPVKLVRNGALLAVIGMLAVLLAPHPFVALVGFALVGAGFSNIVPMVFSATGRALGIAPGVAMASVTTMGYFGFLVGPPFIGFTAELVGLRGALGILVVTSLVMVLLAGTLAGKKVVRA